MQPLMSLLLPLILEQEQDTRRLDGCYHLKQFFDFFGKNFYGQQFPVCMMRLIHVLVLVDFVIEVDVRHRRTFL